MRRRIIAWIVAAVVGLGSAVAVTTPAYALDWCKDAPTPTPPVTGLSGLVTLPPTTPATGDPFTDPRIPISDVYGYSWGWSVYDLGCTPNALADPAAVFDTVTANLILNFASANLAVLGMMEYLARESGVDWFAGWAGQVAASLRPLILGGPTPTGVLLGLLPLAVAALGVVLVWRARKASYAHLARAVLVCVVCIVLASWTLIVPGLAARSADELTQQVGKVAGSTFSASLTDGANRQALYRAWLAGQFGDPDSQLAIDYGPRVMKATHYTWTEWAQVQADPAAREKLDEEKAKEFREIAAEIKDTSPATYLAFQGRADRKGPAIFGMFAAALMSFFALISYAMILMGRVMMQLLVIFTPIAAVFGLLPKGDAVLMRLGGLFAAALVAVFKFTLAAGLMATVLGLLSTLPAVTALLWMTVASVAALVLLKPGKAFKTLTPGLDPNRRYLRELAGVVGKLGLAAATGGVSGAVAGRLTAEAISEETAGPGQPTPAPAAGSVPPPVMERVELSTGPSRPALTPGGAAEVPASPGRWDGVLPPAARPELAAGPTGEVERAVRPVQTHLSVNAPMVHDRAGSGTVESMIVEGEIVSVDDHGNYRRPVEEPRDIVDAEIVEVADLAVLPDRGTDQPSHELVLYQSHKAS